MFAVDDAAADAIQTAYTDGGELSAVVDFRRHFPIMTTTSTPCGTCGWWSGGSRRGNRLLAAQCGCVAKRPNRPGVTSSRPVFPGSSRRKWRGAGPDLLEWGGALGGSDRVGRDTTEQAELAVRAARLSVSFTTDCIAAVLSSTMAAFCWVTWSIWLTAVLTSSRPVGLLLGRGGDFGDDPSISGDLGDDRGRALGRSRRRASTPRPTCCGGGRDQRLDLLGGFGGALRQRADFGGHDREAAAGVAGPRRLDPGVQRQEVGLEGDLVDDADDLADLAWPSARCCPSPPPPRGRSRPDFCASVRVPGDGLADGHGALGGAAHGRGDLCEGGGVCSRLAACCSVRRARSSDCLCDVAGAVAMAPVMVDDAADEIVRPVPWRRCSRCGVFESGIERLLMPAAEIVGCEFG